MPQTHGSTCIQIFVHTGGRWDDVSSTIPELPVSVDIIICGKPHLILYSGNMCCQMQSPRKADNVHEGNLGIPPNLSEATEMITPTLSVDVGLRTGQAVPVLNIYHQFSTKLHVHFERRNNNLTDDYVDLVFLAERYPTEIYALHPYMNRDHREAFWQHFAIRHPDEYARVNRMEMILGLDT